MATTKVTLSLDTVALSLAKAAADRSGASVSAIVSATLNRHLLHDFAPAPTPADPAAEATAALADFERDAAAARYDDQGRGMRAAG
ncbi:hypothetical protein [Nocardia vaccinii]|uniref:hypothetical protein n=1 Tax=Nocardia vaccinii TaxID=1822 RepID=UPI0008323BED|nr:hypothetical protein [Nocardia vaccinii]